MGIRMRNKVSDYLKLTLIIILIGTILRFSLAFIAQPGGDGCFHLNVARFIAENGKIPVFEWLGRDVFSRPPLFHLFGSFLYKLFAIFGNNASIIGMKIVSPLFGSLTLIIVYLIASEMFSKKVGFYSTLFITFLPVHIHYSAIPHIESTLIFFLTLTFYFLLINRLVLAGLSYGLALLVKYQALFFSPILLLVFYLRYSRNFIRLAQKLISFAAISLIVGLPWFIRNYIVLKNPIWPYFNSFFGGAEGVILDSFLHNPSIKHLLTTKIVSVPYLEFFGVPLGEIKYIFYYSFPFQKLLITFWGLATLFFILPLIYGIFKLNYKTKHVRVILFWIFIYLLSFLTFTYVNCSIVGRYLLPIIPVLAIIWGVGLNHLFKKVFTYKLFSVLVFLILIGCIVGFSAAETLKVTMISKNWHNYDEDFNWIKENTPQDAMFFVQGQCFSYYFNRLDYYNPNYYKKDLSYQEQEKTVVNIVEDNNIDYIWVNQHLNLVPESKWPEDVLTVIKENYGSNLIYSNKETGTFILKTN